MAVRALVAAHFGRIDSMQVVVTVIDGRLHGATVLNAVIRQFHVIINSVDIGSVKLNALPPYC
eukprot:m.153117 g.153117  ORF g.153117 m.153117 type:complete len:63 (+) comp9780_c1_seq18:1095-1283(+)